MAKNAKKASKQAGFTLIELLAVITIMGILMMVAIPAVSRTIENSRRDTFANTADQYIAGVKNAVSADELKCTTATDTAMETKIAAVPNGTYYLNLSTTTVATGTGNGKGTFDYQQQTTDLIESGGKSAWSNAEVRGYVKIDKSVTGTTTTYDYSIVLVDTGAHGIGTLAATPVERSAVLSSVTTPTFNEMTFQKTGSGQYECKLAS